MSSGKGLCFTNLCSGRSNVLVSDVKISVAPDEYGNHFDDQNWTAIWDTGATKTVITPKVVQTLNLKVVSKCQMATPHGIGEANCYYINLGLPNHVAIPNLLVIEGVPQKCDVLIGMDIIGQGDFAVCNYQNKTSFSFRVPSISIIDFCEHSYIMPIKKEHSPGRNDPCPCGSGKKYKNCCGKNT